MSETCPICQRALCRTALGDSTDYEQRAACYRIGYDNAAKCALKLSIEVSEQKARADEAEAREATLAAANAALADSVTRCAGIESDLAAEKARADREHAERFQLEKERGEMNAALKAEMARAEKAEAALAAARGECEGLRELLIDVKADLGYAEWGTPEHGANLLQRIIAKHHPRLSAALAAPAAGEETKR